MRAAQIGITGISPEAEPSAARLAKVAGIVEETGAQVLTLDPVEGLTDASAGSDYLEVMQAHLDALREGQHCS